MFNPMVFDDLIYMYSTVWENIKIIVMKEKSTAEKGQFFIVGWPTMWNNNKVFPQVDATSCQSEVKKGLELPLNRTQSGISTLRTCSLEEVYATIQPTRKLRVSIVSLSISFADNILSIMEMCSFLVTLSLVAIVSPTLITASPANTQCGIPGGASTDPFGLRQQFLTSSSRSPKRSTTLSPLETNKVPDARAGAVHSFNRQNTSFISIVDILAATRASAVLPLTHLDSGISGTWDLADEPGNGQRRVVPRSLDRVERQTANDMLAPSAVQGLEAHPAQLCWQVN